MVGGSARCCSHWLAPGAGTALALRTLADLEPLPVTLLPAEDGTPGLARGVQVVDRNGEPLNATFTGAWNRHDLAALHEVPELLRHAFVAAEDKRFFEHRGVDWSARISAVVLNLRNGRAIRGASTITEQVVGMLHPRPPSVWSRWLEGCEAQELERRFTKNEILEFYVNQVPYASNRRGVRQAASHYFARDIDTLSKREMLALAVLVRAPTRFDLKRDAAASAAAIERLANTLVERGRLAPAARDELLAQPFELETPRLAVSAPHFVRHVRAELADREAAPAFAALPPPWRSSGRPRRKSRRPSTRGCKPACSACSTSACGNCASNRSQTAPCSRSITRAVRCSPGSSRAAAGRTDP